MNCDLKESIKTLPKCVSKVIGIASNSASPTDTYILKFNNAEYDDKAVDSGFIKLFITPDSWNTEYLRLLGNYESQNINDYDDMQKIQKTIFRERPIKLRTLISLEYENRIYTEVVKPLIDKNICPHFIRIFNHSDDYKYEDLKKLLPGINEKNLKRNIVYIFTFSKNRPSITSDKDSIPEDIVKNYTNLLTTFSANEDRRLLWLAADSNTRNYSDRQFLFENIDFNKLKFSFILTQAINISNTNTFSYFLEELNKQTIEVQKSTVYDFYVLLFQICYALYALYLSKCAHNDLHLGNIWITERPEPVKTRYVVGPNQYEITSKYCARLYDFDRAYCTRFGNNLILTDNRQEFEHVENRNGLCSYANSCNEVVNAKDFMKVILNLIYGANSFNPPNLLGIKNYVDILFELAIDKKDANTFSAWKDYINPKKKNNYVQMVKIPKVAFENCFPYETILENIYSQINISQEDKNYNSYLPVNQIFECDKLRFDSDGNILF